MRHQALPLSGADAEALRVEGSCRRAHLVGAARYAVCHDADGSGLTACVGERRVSGVVNCAATARKSPTCAGLVCRT
jgi:hypothetical protein